MKNFLQVSKLVKSDASATVTKYAIISQPKNTNLGNKFQVSSVSSQHSKKKKKKSKSKDKLKNRGKRDLKLYIRIFAILGNYRIFHTHMGKYFWGETKFHQAAHLYNKVFLYEIYSSFFFFLLNFTLHVPCFDHIELFPLKYGK